MKEKFDGLVDHLIGNGFFLEEAVEILEKTLIARALECTGGNQTAASKLLGIHRNTLQRKMTEYQVGAPRPRRKPPAKARGRKARAAKAG